MKILGIIPARGGSKGVKDKNISDLFGKPMIAYTIESALKSKLIDKVVVSTDSCKIQNVVESLFPIKVIPRPAQYAQDDSPIEEALLHAVEYLSEKNGYRADIVVWMQANLPIRDDQVIDEAVKGLIDSDADSCVTCYEVEQMPEAMKILNNRGRLIPDFGESYSVRRQEFKKRYLLDGAVVVMRVQNLLKNRGIRKMHVYLGTEVIPIFQKEKKYSIEVDTPDDLEVVKFYLEKHLNQ